MIRSLGTRSARSLALLLACGALVAAATAVQGRGQATPSASGVSPTVFPLISVADPLLVTTWSDGALMGPAVADQGFAGALLVGSSPPLHFTVQSLGDSAVTITGTGLNVSTGAGNSVGFVTTSATSSLTMTAGGGTDRRFLWVAR